MVDLIVKRRPPTHLDYIVISQISYKGGVIRVGRIDLSSVRPDVLTEDLSTRKQAAIRPDKNIFFILLRDFNTKVVTQRECPDDRAHFNT